LHDLLLFYPTEFQPQLQQTQIHTEAKGMYVIIACTQMVVPQYFIYLKICSFSGINSVYSSGVILNYMYNSRCVHMWKMQNVGPEMYG